jgi:oxygen-dependent protoporphyrinogen oxidase
MGRRRVAIVGGGISGLAAAWHLRQGNLDLDLVVLDGSDAPGGKLRRADLAGVAIDVGAESILGRRPEGIDLARAVGLTDRLAHPATMSASIWSRGVLHPMPAGTLMGVPSNPAAALGVLEAEEIAWAEGERDRPMEATLEDLSVGEFVSARVGSAVVDRLVEPLLGGVYAGHTHQLSLRATIPQLWAAAAAGESVTAAAGKASSRGSLNQAPIFAGVVGGVGVLAEELVKSLLAQGVQIKSKTVVREVHETSGEGRRPGRFPRRSCSRRMRS